jgi:hypothetical protein
MELNRRIRVTPLQAGEVLTLLSIPLILAVIYYLTPISFQHHLVLDHTNPALHAFWTNSLVHKHKPGDGHLIGNIVGYTILVLPCWVLYIHRNQRWRFWTGFLILLTIGALAASISSYLAFHEVLGLQIQNDRGFSGVVGAIDGFLVMTILQTFAQEQEEKVAMLSVGLYFAYLFMGLGALTSRYIILGFGVLALIAVFAGTWTKYVAHPEQLTDWGYQNRRLSGILVIAAFVSTFAFAAALPAEITSSSGGLKNIVAHGAGILFGMTVEIVLRRIN